MADVGLQQHLDEVRILLQRARELFGANPGDLPTGIVPEPERVQPWLR